LPWAGKFKGRQEIADFFAGVAQSLGFAEVAPREMIEQGETVVVIGMSSVRVKRTGQNRKGKLGPHLQIQSRKDGVLPGIYRH
jgi:uncharacterized protein